MNERTHFFIKIYLPHFIRKGDVSCVWEVSWRRGQTATYWPKVFSNHSRTSFASWVGSSTVGHWGLKPSVWSTFSLLWHPISNWLQLQLYLQLSVSWLYFCLTSTCFLWAYASATITEFNHVHRSRWYSNIFDRMHLFRCSSAYLHWCISWLTDRSRVTMLHTWDKLRENLPHLQFLANYCVYSSHTDIKLCTHCLYRDTTVLIYEILYLANQLWCSVFITPPTILLHIILPKCPHV